MDKRGAVTQNPAIYIGNRDTPMANVIADTSLKPKSNYKNNLKQIAMKAEELDKIKSTVKALDLSDTNLVSAEHLNNVLKPLFKEGFIIGVIAECKKNSKDANAYSVRVIIPMIGDMKDLMGKSRLTKQAFWFTSFDAVEVGEVFEIEAKKIVIIRNTYNREGEKAKAKWFERREMIVGANRKLKGGYEFVMKDVAGEIEHLMTDVQGNKLYTVQLEPKIFEDITEN